MHFLSPSHATCYIRLMLSHLLRRRLHMKLFITQFSPSSCAFFALIATFLSTFSSVLIDPQRWMMVNDELYRTRKEAVVAYCRVQAYYSSTPESGRRETTKNYIK
jgi:hypothetical protein